MEDVKAISMHFYSSGRGHGGFEFFFSCPTLSFTESFMYGLNFHQWHLVPHKKQKQTKCGYHAQASVRLQSGAWLALLSSVVLHYNQHWGCVFVCLYVYKYVSVSHFDWCVCRLWAAALCPQRWGSAWHHRGSVIGCPSLGVCLLWGKW